MQKPKNKINIINEIIGVCSTAPLDFGGNNFIKQVEIIGINNV